MRVFVAGATGILGRHVVPRLIERGHDVRALVRSADKAAPFQRLGIDHALGDILDRASLDAAVAGCDAALHLATAVPRPGMKRDFTQHDRIRREGTANLIAACRAAKVERYVQQSIAHLAANGGDKLLDETAPIHGPAATSSAADMEEQVRRSDLRWSILRGGAFYGEGTGREEEWLAPTREGRLLLPGNGSAYLSLIHAMDMADAVVLAAEQAPPSALLAIVDDEPVTYRTLFTYLAALTGGPAPAPGGPATNGSFRVSNARARAVLGWQPRFKSYRSGFA